MYNVGIFPGKFLPPHRGHLNAIIQAATQVKKLYVVISDNSNYTKKVCEEEGLRPMPLTTRARWLAKELENFDHIDVIALDETNIEPYPIGTIEWSKKLVVVVPEDFDVIFGGETEYQYTYMHNFPGIDYVVYDTDRNKYPVSATKIRNNPIKYWDYILGSARENFTKRVLVTGVESCGKTSLTKYLAKIYHTSWSEEVGRYYSDWHMGGNERFFVKDDFYRIAFQQFEQDFKAIHSSNKIVFFDTDAVVTAYYLEQYLNDRDRRVEDFVDPNKYDLVLFMEPTVPWVADGKRFNSEDMVRQDLSKHLYSMYERFFGKSVSKVVRISNSSYKERLNRAIDLVDNLMEN